VSSMKAKEEYLALFELGCADIKLVEKNLRDKDIRGQLLLFHLQQAVEKFLKALLSLHRIKFPKIHDISELIELCEEAGVTLPEYVEEFISLTPYAVEFRYGLMIEEILDVKYYYRKALKLKKVVEKIIQDKE
jgi:HEPN domain-containing protein